MKNFSKEEILEQEKLEKGYEIIWNHVKSHPNTDTPCSILINQIGELFNLTNFNSAGLKIDQLLTILIRRDQIKQDSKFLYVVGDKYMSVSEFNFWLSSKGKTMNTETKLADPTFTIPPETAKELMVIGEHMKNRFGIDLTHEQVIQHLIHMFKIMNPQGMPLQPFATFPGPNPVVTPQMPMYPTGARWANNSNPNGLHFEEIMRNQDNLRNKKFNPGSDDNNNMPVNK